MGSPPLIIRPVSLCNLPVKENVAPDWMLYSTLCLHGRRQGKNRRTSGHFFLRVKKARLHHGNVLFKIMPEDVDQGLSILKTGNS